MHKQKFIDTDNADNMVVTQGKGDRRGKSKEVQIYGDEGRFDFG